MSSHTKGPWTHMAGMPTNVLDQSGLRVARCDFDGDFDSPEALANARLIAAAPELLEACQHLVSGGIYLGDVRAIIAKATGVDA